MTTHPKEGFSLKDACDLFEDSDMFTFSVPTHSGTPTNPNYADVEFFDDAGLSSYRDAEKFFIAGHEFGPSILIHARSFESAWEAWIDQHPTIPESELPEAYGILDSKWADEYKKANPSPNHWERDAWNAWHETYHAAAMARLQELGDAAREGGDDYPELIEGYEMQSSCSGGTGIVNVGDYSWMNEIELADIQVKRKLVTNEE